MLWTSFEGGGQPPWAEEDRQRGKWLKQSPVYETQYVLDLYQSKGVSAVLEDSILCQYRPSSQCLRMVP